MREAAGAAVKVVLFGDSITAGQYVDPPATWPHLLGGLLGEVLDGEAARVRIVAHGVSGETTRQALERFPRQVQDEQPEVVAIQFGLNDCNCWQTDRGLPRVSLAAFRANLEEMVARARHFMVREVVLSTNHPTLKRGPMPGGEAFESARRRYNDTVRDVAGALGCTLCDIEAGFPTDPADLKPLLLPAPDLLHLSPAGHRLYASLIAPTLAGAIRRFGAAVSR